MSDSEDPIDNVDELEGDLFGDDDADQPLSEVEEVQSDGGLASDRDEDEPRERHSGDEDENVVFNEKKTQEVPLYRHRIPRPQNDKLISMKVPDYINIDPREYKAETWEPSKWDMENAKLENPVPSALFRRDPETGRMQSNTNVYQWDDGSVTIAIGDQHYEISTKQLAPQGDEPYKEVKDAHYYAAAAHLTTNSLLMIGHFTEQYQLKPNKGIADHALEKLKADIADTQKERQRDILITTIEDPELQKKQAEQAEKEALKAQRRRENAAARAEGTSSRYKGGSLSVGDLEGRRGAGAAGRKRGAPGGAKKKHRRPEYDSDDDLPSGARQNDNYDMEDGFLVDSDEDSEEVVDDDEEEELLDDEDEDEAPKKKRQKTKAKTAAADLDADGEEDLDDDDAPAHSSRRRRHIIDDDDDEE
ncbi:Leo1-like domain containing protein [Rhypophila decipiens]